MSCSVLIIPQRNWSKLENIRLNAMFEARKPPRASSVDSTAEAIAAAML